MIPFLFPEFKNETTDLPDETLAQGPRALSKHNQVSTPDTCYYARLLPFDNMW